MADEDRRAARLKAALRDNLKKRKARDRDTRAAVADDGAADAAAAHGGGDSAGD